MLVQFQHCGFSSAKGVPSCFELRKSINDSAWQKKKRTHVDKSAHLWDRIFPESKTQIPTAGRLIQHSDRYKAPPTRRFAMRNVLFNHNSFVLALELDTPQQKRPVRTGVIGDRVVYRRLSELGDFIGRLEDFFPAF